MDLIVRRLKERKIVQWALAYLGGAWLVLQVVDVTSEPWGMSTGLVRAIQVLLAVGFFVTLIVAWYHGEQGRQGVSGPELILIGGVLGLSALLVMIFVNPMMESGEAGAGARVDEVADRGPPGLTSNASVAVLPFRNISPNAEDAYVASGVHQDILTALSRIRDLTVLSRTSVERYQDVPDASLRDIGRELGATAILEGSVQIIEGAEQRDQNTIRVNVSLNDVETDASLWAEAYDRELEDIFAMQSEIAQRVAEALEATLTPEEFEIISRVPTDNLDAYDLHLRGREAYLRHTPEENDEAVRLHRLALELDPEYALSWAGLASAFADKHYRFRAERSWADSALFAAERALELDPSESSAHNALGFIYGGIFGWRQRAYEEYQHAWQLDPNNSVAMGNLGASQRLLGRLDEALDWYERAIRVDPGPNSRENVASVYLVIGDTARAADLKREELLRAGAESQRGLALQAELAVIEDADHQAAREILEALVERYPAEVDYRLEAAEAAFQLGDFESVIEHVAEASRLSPAVLEQVAGSGRQPRAALLYGLALTEVARGDEGRDVLRDVIALRRGQIAEGHEDGTPWLDLTVAHGALGQMAEALEAFETAREIGGASIAELLGPSDTYWAAIERTPLPSEADFEAVLELLEQDVADMRTRIEERESGR